MSAHTPKPWRVSRIVGGANEGALCVRGARSQLGYEGAVVCLVAPAGEITAEDEANARLIAASPAAFAALKEALQSLEYIDRIHPEVSGGFKRQADCERARKVIAEAEAQP